MEELSERITNSFQLSTDAFPAYQNLVHEVFGIGIDYAQIHKVYGAKQNGKSDTVLTNNKVRQDLYNGKTLY